MRHKRLKHCKRTIHIIEIQNMYRPFDVDRSTVTKFQLLFGLQVNICICNLIDKVMSYVLTSKVMSNGCVMLVRMAIQSISSLLC